MIRTRIKATGAYVPERRVTNEELTKWMDTTHEWIVQRTGIEARHWTDEGIGSSELGRRAAEQALERAGWSIEDVDLIIFATLAPDIQFPGSGAVMAGRLGFKTTPVLDIRNQCSGFLYGLTVADQFIRTGHHQRVMIVGAERHSVGLDVTTRGRDVSVIFGDGAAAVCVEAYEGDDKGVLMSRVHADGRYWDRLMVEGPTGQGGTFYKPDEFLGNKHAPYMEGPFVFKHAIRRLQQAAQEALDESGLALDDIDLVIPHQANMRINQMVAAKIGLPEDKLFHNMQEYGNTTAASIPLALHDAIQQGRVPDGATVMMVAFGAGFTWGSSVVQF